jgi:hypothetical protein
VGQHDVKYCFGHRHRSQFVSSCRAHNSQQWEQSDHLLCQEHRWRRNNAVTVTLNAPTRFVEVRIAEYSGLDRTNPLDVNSSASGTSQTANSGPVTTTSANELLVASGTTQTFFNGSGSGYTLRTITQPNGSILQDRIVTSTGTYEAPAPQVTTSNWVMQLVTFRAPGQ